MQAVVVYYSFDGNTRIAAERLALDLGAEAIELRIERSNGATERYEWGTNQVYVSSAPQVTHDEVNFQAVDLIVLGTPVWAGSMSPAMRGFLHNTEFFRKRFAIFCCFGGRAGRCLTDMKDLLIGNEVASELALREPVDLGDGRVSSALGDWSRQLRALVPAADPQGATGE